MGKKVFMFREKKYYFVVKLYTLCNKGTKKGRRVKDFKRWFLI